MKHIQTRWLSLDRVLVRILEQYQNLKCYFLERLPELPGFKGKNGIRETERYQRIIKGLKNPLTRPYMSFVINVAQQFKSFLIPFQRAEPKIQILHEKCLQLITDIAMHLMDSSKIHDADGKLIKINELIKILDNKENHKVSF